MKYNDLMPKMKVDPETYVSIFVTFDHKHADVKGCKSRSSKQMEKYAKRTLLKKCHWRRCTTSIEVLRCRDRWLGKNDDSIESCMFASRRQYDLINRVRESVDLCNKNLFVLAQHYCIHLCEHSIFFSATFHP